MIVTCISECVTNTMDQWLIVEVLIYESRAILDPLGADFPQ